MIQAIIRKGKVFGEEVTTPRVTEGSVLIQVLFSCISAGTEITSVNSSGKSLIKRALEQPDKVIKYLNKIKTKGFTSTYKEIKSFSEFGQPTGYSISGVVVAVGKGVTKFVVGEKVVAAGGGYAYHAEFVDVPENLVIKTPQKINMSFASSVALGGIALQGVRRANLKLGEYAVVLGTGIIGLLTVQLLKIAGIRVVAIDINKERLLLAQELGSELIINSLEENPLQIVEQYTGGRGVDAVLFTAATSSSKPLSDSFKMCKRKGRVVLIGVSGMEIERQDIYSKELDFLISTSYGPGRYDKQYEEKGCDYPYAYVRWTEARNMEEYLRRIDSKELDIQKLIHSVHSINDVEHAYQILQTVKPKPLMVILKYNSEFEENNITLNDKNIRIAKVENKINVALIGTGNFAQNIHLPNMKKLNDKFFIRTLMSQRGIVAKDLSKEYAVPIVTNSYDEILNDENIDLVMICTRHSNHGKLTLEALRAGKNVFVEKPLCTTVEELNEIKSFYETDSDKIKPILTVGYNRRFSKYAKEIKKHTDRRINPLFIIYRMNAGYISFDHWVHEEGGRIVGEACHIIDLMNFLTGSQIISITSENINPKNEKYSTTDNKVIVLRYEDGSICNINYFAVGSKSLAKEYMEIHFDGKSIIMDDYKILKGYGINIDEIKTEVSEKGHFEEMKEFATATLTDNPYFPIELWDLFQTSEITLNILS